MDTPERGWTDRTKKPAGADAEPGASLMGEVLASSMGEGLALTNGAALYPDSAIPWAIEAAAREAVEESLE